MVAMRGVIEVEVETRIALRINLSCQTQWVIFKVDWEVPSDEGHNERPMT